VSRLKVLIPVDHAVGISGPHRNVVGSLNALGARDDVEVVLLTSVVERSEPYGSASNIDICLGFRPHDPKRIIPNLWNMQRAARGCDVIYVPSGLKAFLYAQSARIGRPLVAGPNVTPLPIGKKRHDSPSRFELDYMCDAWIEMSRHRRDHVRRVTGYSDVGFIHHAIDTARFSPARRGALDWEELGFRPGSTKVLYVGRDNEPRKGVAQLLDAAERIAAAGRTDIEFALVGRMSPTTLARTESMDTVRALEFRKGEALADVYANADISVVPSSWESFGFTALEAMASGIPVVTACAGGLPEIVEDAGTGILLDIADHGIHRPDAGIALAAAITRLADDRELRTSMGESGRERALAHFSEARLGEDLVKLFRRVLDGAATWGSDL
jgi:glycosyltransferase involved in cell wall biosynthesis